MLTRLRSRPVRAMVLYFLVYEMAFLALENWDRPYHIVHCALDNWVPFCRYAVVPYLLWFAWVPLTLLWMLRRSPDGFWRLFLSIAGGTAFALCVYAVYPTVQLGRRTLYGRDAFASLIRFIYAVDTPTNVCPSLHVFVSVVVLMAVWGCAGLARRYKLLHTLLAVAICLSTVLIRQHSCIDVFWGVVLAVVVYGLAGAALSRCFGPWPQREKLRIRRA